MPVFEYTALDKRGKKVNGVLDAEGLAGARTRLRATGIYPVTLREVAAAAAGPEPQSGLAGRLLGKRVKPLEVSLVTRQLATLLGAGFPLVQALDALIPQTPSAGFQKKLTQIKDAVVGGSNFADALGRAGETFPPVYVNMVRSGEASGTLEIVLERLADVTEKQQAVRARIRNAMTYPILMLVIGSAVLIFLLTYIVPTISGIFAEVKQVLPLPTRLLLGFSGWMRAYWWTVPIALAALFQILRTVRRTSGGRLATDRTILNIPLVGSLVQRLNVARIMRTFGSLLENGGGHAGGTGNRAQHRGQHHRGRSPARRGPGRGPGPIAVPGAGGNSPGLSTAGDPDDRCRRAERQARADAGQDRRHV